MDRPPLSAYEARFEAQRLAFAPITFHCINALRELKILEALVDSGIQGIKRSDLTQASPYALKILIDVGIESGLIEEQDDKIKITKVGYFLATDEMTQINFDFVRDICYAGLADLTPSLKNGRPAGLKKLGEWSTVYEGLQQLEPAAKKSWFSFDHFYSDTAFAKAAQIIMKEKPQNLLDVGANTGRFANVLLKQSSGILMSLFDLPPQIEKARLELAHHPQENLQFFCGDVLHEHWPINGSYDAIWMSQFLDCFSPEQIVRILKNACHRLRDEKGNLFILEPFIDRQKHAQARFALIHTSVYFACIANGKSRMYEASEMQELIEQAGLRIVEAIDDVGRAHTLLRCQKQNESHH